MAMTIRETLHEAVQVLTQAGLVSPRLDAEVLLAHSLGQSRVFLFAHPEQELMEGQVQAYRHNVSRRVLKEPVAYIVGCKEFWSLPLNVDKRVLIPRPETEILVEEALKIAAGFDNVAARILDVGVGSGAISLALASELKHAHIVAIDVSPEAITVAESNARKLGLEHRVSFVVGDLTRPLTGAFDMIVSNPPYIAAPDMADLPEGVKGFEPHGALDGGPDGLFFYKGLVCEGENRLKKGGWLLMEIGAGQKDPLEEILRESCLYDEIRFCEDYAGFDRVVLARRWW
ncbi:MAG: Release factor glutamine methyltransferase [Syntrophus sp. SKADARSKE-3]|nr:Release factor glutamine methyltransferase [Syntrophus sp. SKADARSKE-3]